MRTRILALVLPLALFGVVACDEDGSEPDPGPYTLTFEGDATFQGAHADQTIRVALVSSGGTVEAEMEGTVSATADPAFSFTFPNVLAAGQSYEIHYWIDSNFGGGAMAVCDGPATDHQWRLSVTPQTSDATITDTHRPTETEDVCSTFAANLTFEGDDTFQGAHGGQDIQVGVVRASDGVLITSATGTVSSTADPSFSFEFPGALLKDSAYEVHYWIDSNFAGGTQGTCDPVDDDHQWAVDLGTPTEDNMVYTDTHRPTEQSAVCSTFQ